MDENLMVSGLARYERKIARAASLCPSPDDAAQDLRVKMLSPPENVRDMQAYANAVIRNHVRSEWRKPVLFLPLGDLDCCAEEEEERFREAPTGLSASSGLVWSAY